MHQANSVIARARVWSKRFSRGRDVSQRNLVRAAMPLALAVSITGGYLLRITTEPEQGLLVNGGDVQRVVYEAVGNRGVPPPQCRATSEDGIGSWDCLVESKIGPQVFHVVVTRKGAVRGKASEGPSRFSSCCVEVIGN